MLNILLLVHDFGFPEGYAATLRARLLARSLVEAGASVQVFCARFSEIPPDILNTQAQGVYEGIEFRYTGGSTVRASSFLKRRLVDARSLGSSLSSIYRLHRAGKLDVVYFYSTPKKWSAFTETYMSFLRAMGIPTVLEINETPWPLMDDRSLVEKRLSPLRGVSGTIVISEYLEQWVAAEAERLGRVVSTVHVPIVVDTDEAQTVTPAAPRGRPYVVFACPPERPALFTFVSQAMETVWRRGKTCDLLIAGPSLHQARNSWLAEVAASAGGEPDRGSVVWLGTLPRSTLLGLYQQAAALLLPLADELNTSARFPTKLGEYLVSGTPVVASDRGELRRYLRDGESAYLVGSGDADAFGRRIADVLDDPASARKVAGRGREVAVENFDYRLYGKVLYDWFAAIAEKGR